MDQPSNDISTLALNRVERLIGRDNLTALSEANIILFGVGGVGSWTAESLVRSGVRRLTIVDPDKVAASNINRQLMALHSTVGLPKVQVLKQRLLDIAPDAQITAIEDMYCADTAHNFNLDNYSYVIDAIDSLADKALLILNTTAVRTPLVSSMGAALKLDPTKVAVAEFWKVQGCPLAAALRRKFKHSGKMPRRKFKCVYSPELVANCPDTPDDTSGAMSFNKVRINGAICHITAIFGFTLAGLVIEGLLATR